MEKSMLQEAIDEITEAAAGQEIKTVMVFAVTDGVVFAQTVGCGCAACLVAIERTYLRHIAQILAGEETNLETKVH